MLILLVTTDAMSRSFFARPIAGVNEMVQVSIIGISFHATGRCHSHGQAHPS